MLALGNPHPAIVTITGTKKHDLTVLAQQFFRPQKLESDIIRSQSHARDIQNMGHSPYRTDACRKQSVYDIRLVLAP
jgi:hypothetical protein